MKSLLLINDLRILTAYIVAMSIAGLFIIIAAVFNYWTLFGIFSMSYLMLNIPVYITLNEIWSKIHSKHNPLSTNTLGY